MKHEGRFPFGRLNQHRPLRLAPSGKAKALVIGVYPSAFHVAWSPPADLDDRPREDQRKPYVASLAVDVEPTVFWDGVAPEPTAILEEWKAKIGFREAWGTARIGHNGPSGTGVLDDYLAPLRLDIADVAMTDVVPWFFIKEGRPG